MARRSDRAEPLAALISLLRPQSVATKLITGAGAWSVRYAAQESTGYCVVLAGGCFVETRHGAIELRRGDFLLFPQTPAFTLASDLRLPATPVTPTDAREIRRGAKTDAVTMRMLGGYFRFDRANAQLLVGLLPPVVHIRARDAGAVRLRRVVEQIGDEAADDRPGRALILERLVEILLIEALRFRVATAAPEQGLLAGLADPALARPLRGLHVDVARRWTVAELARAAGMSRAVFAARFAHTVGMPPMHYLLAWRMAIAKDLLRTAALSLVEVGQRVGYRSTSAFSAAFARHTGQSPSAFARQAG